MLVAGVAPLKVHDHDVGILVERSIKLTVEPTSAVVLSAIKSADGAELQSPVISISSIMNA